MFGFSIFLALVAVVAVITASLTKGDTRAAAGFASAVAFAVAVIAVLVASYSPVDTQNIGVIISFGRPDGEVTNGIHWIEPWAGMTQIDGAIQTQTFEGPGCVNVRIGQQQQACADVILRWRIRPPAADALYRNYHGGPSVIDDISGSLVHPVFVNALNANLDTYDPVAATTATPGSAANPHLADIARAVAAQMRGDLRGQITVLSVTIPRLVYPQSVQDRINQENQQAAQTVIAQEAVRTAQAQAQANAALSQSVAKSPLVLVAECMNVIEALQKSGQSIPVGFSCWPGANSGVNILANGG